MPPKRPRPLPSNPTASLQLVLADGQMVPVDVCERCAALVADHTEHIAWHDLLA